MSNMMAVDAVTGVRRMFYAVTPNETSFQTLEEVPPYILEAVPFFLLTVIIEEFILRVNGKDGEDRFADSITSLIAGQFQVITGIFMRAVEVGVYIYVYDNMRMLDLAWDSPWTWVVSFLGIDLGYYWFHRMAHEVNFMWAAHQVHHSSEEYNYTTALRQSIFQRFSWIFYLPLALVAPPSHMFVHMQFNTIFQFWIHTELVSSLGPLEYILNTPSHHRVHHGRNRYCIDKNYAGVLIIWDKLFGTFEAENESIAYGLVHPVTTYNPITLQIFHYQWVWSTFWSTPGFRDKLKVLFYGPGWAPGKPRTGLLQEIPDVKGPELHKYRTLIPGWLKAYIFFHFVINLLIFQSYMTSYKQLSQLHTALGMAYIIYTFTCIGMLCDLRPWWNYLAEMARCAAVFAVTFLTIQRDPGSSKVMFFLQVTFGLSTLFWLLFRGSMPGVDKKKET